MSCIGDGKRRLVQAIHCVDLYLELGVCRGEVHVVHRQSTLDPVRDFGGYLPVRRKGSLLGKQDEEPLSLKHKVLVVC